MNDQINNNTQQPNNPKKRNRTDMDGSYSVPVNQCHIPVPTSQFKPEGNPGVYIPNCNTNRLEGNGNGNEQQFTFGRPVGNRVELYRQNIPLYKIMRQQNWGVEGEDWDYIDVCDSCSKDWDICTCEE
jgi:hypothetical protein